MPPAAAWNNDTYLLKSTTGRIHPPNAAFMASLTGQARLLAAPTHVLVALLGHCLSPATGSSGSYVPLRLYIYLLVPWMTFDSTSDALTFPFYPLPSAAAKFLYRLVKVGMPTEKVHDERAARTLIGIWANRIAPDRRTFDASHFVQVTVDAANFLRCITPPATRTRSSSNQEVAEYLCMLQGGFTDTEAGARTFTDYCVMLAPFGTPAGAPLQLIAVRSCSHVRSTAPDPPHDVFICYEDILSEVTRRHEITPADRFKPLFDQRFLSVYVTAAASFPRAVEPAEMRDRLAALAVALGMRLDFTHVGVNAICSVLQPQLTSLEVETPAATSSDDERFAALLRLHKDQPGGRIAPSGDGSESGRQEAGENMKLLLNNASYMSLYQEVLALNTNATSMAAVVAVVAKHAHPAGLIIMTSKRMLRQPAWEHVLGFRQQKAWQQAFDVALAVDTEGVHKPHRGKMLPVGKDGAPTTAASLLNMRLCDISNWHELCMKHVELNEGKHVLADERYANCSGVAFWQNPDILRLDEEPLRIIFDLIGHGQSRSVTGSFRHFYFHQIARAERIRRLPKDIVAYPSLVAKMNAAMLDVLQGVQERHTSMAVRAFHLMQRSVFVPVGEAGEKALKAIDTQLTLLKDQLEKVASGEADHQALNIQLSAGGQSAFIGFGGTATGTAVTGTALDIAASGQLKQLEAQNKALQKQLQQARSNDQQGKSPYPAGIFISWGDAAYRYGIYRAPEGIVFGGQLVQSKKAVDLSGKCLATVAVSNNVKQRSQWCSDVAHCKNYAAHDRPDEISSDDLVVTQLDLDTVDTSQWSCVIPAHADCLDNGRAIPAPKPSWPIETGPGTTYDTSQGKGKSRGGKGKGGKGRGSGLTGRKRDASNFEWPSMGHKTTEGSSCPSLGGPSGLAHSAKRNASAAGTSFPVAPLVW